MFLTTAQRALLRENVGRGIFAVSIAHSAGTLRFCNGDGPIQIGGNWYTPRGMSLLELSISSKGNSSQMAFADDHTDEVNSLERLNYSSRFSGVLLWWYFYFWADDGTGWNEIFKYAWTVDQCSKTENEARFNIYLNSASGTRPRSASERIGRACGLTYGDALCGGSIGTYKSCDGSMAACVLRGRQESFRGAIMAPKPGAEIEFYNRESPYQIGATSYTPPPPPGGENHGTSGSDTPIQPVVHTPNQPPGQSGDLPLIDDYIQQTHQDM